jgi:FAD-dependent monooxygenase
MGKEFTLVDFTPSARYTKMFEHVAKELSIPLKVIHLPAEAHLREIWEDRDAVLIRPDDHVAWRTPPTSSQQQSLNKSEVQDILSTVVGKKSTGVQYIGQDLVSKYRFTGTAGTVAHDEVQGLAAFQC